MAYTTIKKPSDYFNTKLYTGNGTDNRSITGLDFQPDWVWIKERDDTNAHYIFDSVRGIDKQIQSNSNAAEYDYSGDPGRTLKSFDSDGFTLGTGAGVNGSGELFVAWNWLGANGTASNTDGTITSTVSANTTNGFSIVSYTGNGTSGATVGHGLSVAPSMVIVKQLNATGSWVVYHKSQGATKFGIMDTTATFGTSSSLWNDTAPTNSVFSLGNDGDTNGASQTFIAYCFADVKGFSKFGSYVGNGSADGTFVYTGFKPAFFLFKRTDGANSWGIMDNKRSTSGANVIDKGLKPDSANAEYTAFNKIDFTSNGIKLRSTDSDNNASGATYLYMAFAEEPLVGDNPATAR